MATSSVMPAIFAFENLVSSNMSCEIFPEQLIIKESAVDIVAAKIPEMIRPTINGLNNICAIMGKANSGSNPAVLSKISLDNIPTVKAKP